MGKSIYIIEDEIDIQNLLKYLLKEAGYNINAYTSGEEALGDIEFKSPDLILLDLMLPGLSGFEICRRLKNNPNTWNIPVIILTARSEEFDIINAINIGCDDYITKPFSEKILMAKIKSMLFKEERKKISQTNILKINNLMIDADQYTVSNKGKIITMTASEFKLLHFLAKNINCVFTRPQLYESIRDSEIYIGDRSIDTLIGRVRKKIGSYGKYIETIYGVGYRFVKPE